MLVVSPLIALMKDQLAHLPPGLPGAMLWSGQQASEALKTLAAIKVCCQQPVYSKLDCVGALTWRILESP